MVVLERYAFPDALGRFCDAIRRFAAAKGKAERYHETITVAYMLLIAERLDNMRGATWTEFADRNGDLLERKPSILARLLQRRDACVRPRAAGVRDAGSWITAKP